MSWLVSAKDYLEALSYLTVLLGLPLALHQFWKTARREQLDREYGTYNALDEKYIDFQNLCFQNPRLNIFDLQDQQPAELSEEEKKQQLIAFTILFSIFERAYLMYSDQDSDIKARQWTGWRDYIQSYCQRDNFKHAWALSGNTFDTNYQEFMEATIRECEE